MNISIKALQFLSIFNKQSTDFGRHLAYKNNDPFGIEDYYTTTARENIFAFIPPPAVPLVITLS